MASSQSSQSDEGSTREREELPCTSRDQGGPQPRPQLGLQPLCDVVLHKKVDELVDFLLLKYNNKDVVTKAELLHSIKDYQEHFPLIFSKVSECLYMVFGIDVKEVDPPGHIYALLPVLGLTYNKTLGGEQGIPKNSLLIIMLSAIFTNGNHVSEEVVWEMLSRMQVFDGVEHCIYGEPRKLITEELVQEGYLEYHEVPNSDPACYEFLWGPRAYAETTKMKVLEHLAKVHGTDPLSYPRLYAEALREEEEAAHV
ncbi:PREDICTED: melanoma-associated antigen 10-like [Chinchilla lanigera]|uniref:melanoma-associated antigen 10-like n=1 Tax=Chinchilla lanigera TaxID=34839 RepID=UPI00038E9CD8|nr:PREDICTED: melanoma-associated antigen 10-like [Chinchilla lanigera]XP_013360987.1 PREDICTED: melanoma-associated antigen 10-like [Chinchilla lanigera]XP_013360988.1 PREDICTED: melanoma-associated antigen 10-like [Chinchilla lanigera]XP_013360989.1 PREDICTED: melanoma-associated antigen 10-like [Chinchilla lanigera]